LSLLSTQLADPSLPPYFSFSLTHSPSKWDDYHRIRGQRERRRRKKLDAANKRFTEEVGKQIAVSSPILSSSSHNIEMKAYGLTRNNSQGALSRSSSRERNAIPKLHGMNGVKGGSWGDFQSYLEKKPSSFDSQGSRTKMHTGVNDDVRPEFEIKHMGKFDQIGRVGGRGQGLAPQGTGKMTGSVSTLNMGVEIELLNNLTNGYDQTKASGNVYYSDDSEDDEEGG
jgi:hypothetical protein